MSLAIFRNKPFHFEQIYVHKINIHIFENKWKT